MTDEQEEEEEKYPSVREALFGDNTIANIRCAIKWLVWHTMYVLLTVFGLLFVGVMTVVMKVAGFIDKHLPEGPDVSGRLGPLVDKLAVACAKFDRYVEDIGAKDVALKAAQVVVALGIIGAILFSLGFFVWLAFTQPWILATSLGGVVALFGVLAIIAYIEDETNAKQKTVDAVSKTKEKAVETPGVRRVYGNCPVHMDMEPKWFQKVSEKFD